MPRSNYLPMLTFWFVNGFGREDTVTLYHAFKSLTIEQLVFKSDEYIRDTLNAQGSLTSVQINSAILALQKERKILSKLDGHDPMYKFWAQYLEDVADVKSLTNEFKGSTVEQMRHMSRDTLVAKLTKVRLSDFVRKFILEVVLSQQPVQPRRIRLPSPRTTPVQRPRIRLPSPPTTPRTPVQGRERGNNQVIRQAPRPEASRPGHRHLREEYNVNPPIHPDSQRTAIHRYAPPSDSSPPRTARNPRVYAPPPGPPPARLLAKLARERELMDDTESDLRELHEHMNRVHN